MWRFGAAWRAFLGEKIDLTKWRDGISETIGGRTFAKQVVEIDGRIFQECCFENVKFLFHGIARPQFYGCTIRGNCEMQTDHVAINVFMRLVHILSRSGC